MSIFAHRAPTSEKKRKETRITQEAESRLLLRTTFCLSAKETRRLSYRLANNCFIFCRFLLQAFSKQHP